MLHINSTQFGQITIDHQTYRDVLIINDQVVPRDDQRLHDLFGTGHTIGDWEIQALIKDKPETIIIATGQSGVLKVDQKLVDQIESEGINLINQMTPQALETYNQLVEAGRKVNGLFHTTC